MATNRTFKGIAKPFGKSGHFNEPQRHAMQAKGFKTGTHNAHPLDFIGAKPKPLGREVVKRFGVYKFDELSKEAQEKALEKQREFEGEIWTADDYLIPNFKEEMEKYGVSRIDVSYSGFWSQGDGASFTGLVDLKKYIKETKQEKYYAKLLKAMENEDVDDSLLIERTSHQYAHENTIRANDVRYNGEDKEIQAQADRLSEEMTSFAREKSRELYKQMNDDYDNATSDESLKDSINVNEYEFTEDGKIY